MTATEGSPFVECADFLSPTLPNWGTIHRTNGERLIKTLSERLSKDFGKGFDRSNLHHMRSFYMATTSTVLPARRGAYAQILLECFARNLVTWGQNGIEISKVYAASNTASGIRILKHAGFQTIKDLGSRRYVFEINIDTPGTMVLLGYKEAI
jgi:hypothetical protein